MPLKRRLLDRQRLIIKKQKIDQIKIQGYCLARRYLKLGARR